MRGPGGRSIRSTPSSSQNNYGREAMELPLPITFQATLREILKCDLGAGLPQGLTRLTALQALALLPGTSWLGPLARDVCEISYVSFVAMELWHAKGKACAPGFFGCGYRGGYIHGAKRAAVVTDGVR